MWWVRHQKSVALKIDKLIKDIQRDPTSGIGKPERLKHDLAGLWSRRITDEHRLVYEVLDDGNGEVRCIIIACRYHYDG